MLYCIHETESVSVPLHFLLVFYKEHLYLLCRPSLLSPRSLKHQPSRLNFNTGSVKGYNGGPQHSPSKYCEIFPFAFKTHSKLYNCRQNKPSPSKLLAEFLLFYKISSLLSSVTIPLYHFQGRGHVRRR